MENERYIDIMKKKIFQMHTNFWDYRGALLVTVFSSFYWYILKYFFILQKVL